MNPATLQTRVRLDRIVITDSNGRRYDLGCPSSIFFPLRLRFYKWRRRNELKEPRQ